MIRYTSLDTITSTGRPSTSSGSASSSSSSSSGCSSAPSSSSSSSASSPSSSSPSSSSSTNPEENQIALRASSSEQMVSNPAPNLPLEFSFRQQLNTPLMTFRHSLSMAKALMGDLPCLLGVHPVGNLGRIEFKWAGTLRVSDPEPPVSTRWIGGTTVYRAPFHMSNDEYERMVFEHYRPSKLVRMFLDELTLTGAIKKHNRTPDVDKKDRDLKKAKELKHTWCDGMGDLFYASNIIEHHVYAHYDPASVKNKSVIKPTTRMEMPTAESLRKRRVNRESLERLAVHKRRKLMNGDDRGRDWDGYEEAKYPSWKDLKIPVCHENTYGSLTEMRQRVGLLDLVHFHLLSHQIDLLNDQFDILMDKTQGLPSDRRNVIFWKLACLEFEDYRPMFPLTLDTLFDMVVSNHPREWGNVACELVDEKMTRLAKYVRKCYIHFKPLYNLTDADAANMYAKSYNPLMVLDLLTIDYCNAYTFMNYISANFPRRCAKKNKQGQKLKKVNKKLTKAETGLIDEVLSAMKKVSEHDFDLLDHALLKLLLIVRTYKQNDGFENVGRMYAFYSDVEIAAQRLVELREKGPVVERTEGVLPVAHAKWLSWIDILEYCESIATKFCKINPMRWPLIIKALMRISYVKHRSVPALLPLEFHQQVVLKRTKGQLQAEREEKEKKVFDHSDDDDVGEE